MSEQALNVEILYEDEHLIALNKPAGLLVHPSWLAPRGTPNLASILKQYWSASPYTVHRLDRPTSGVILFAKHKAVAQALNLTFAEHRIEKTYLCVCRGYVSASGTIDYPLQEEKDKIADKFMADDKPPQDAITDYRCLAQVELPLAVGRYATARYSLVQVKPKTGRKHQIRRHMKHIFHPIAGDTKHGDNKHNTVLRQHYALNRLLLMATELRFTHPVTEEELLLTAGVDADTDRLLTAFGWQGRYPVVSQPSKGLLTVAQDIE
ncbi:tRNA pseudouridine(65) synthase TruC [Pontibacter sp. JAM-7]|uniref:tRNA pseudouridine(65) synthase TruC n=1 Tax=Pontibacter sp. JAM-7 TaxID=3366581 RepID=UPI003AF51882